MASDETNSEPTTLQSYAGVIVFFNPHWVVEIKTGERTVFVLRKNKYRRCRQRVIVIHTLVNAYQIPMRRWIELCDPLSYSILFSMSAIWRINSSLDADGGEHVITGLKKHKFLFFTEDADAKNKEKIKFSYLDVERVECRDGAVLWQKQR